MSSARQQLEKGLQIAEEGIRLEKSGMKDDAIARFLEAIRIMESVRSSPGFEFLREHIEVLVSRCERIKAESIWNARAAVLQNVYQQQQQQQQQLSSSGLLSPPPSVSSSNSNSSCLSSPAPRGLGTYVTSDHSSFPLVQCLLMTLRLCCSLDHQERDEPLPPLLLHVQNSTHALSSLSSVPYDCVTEYYPHVFRNIRKRNRLNLAKSVGPECRGMFELQSPGKSGSFMFFTSDMSFLVKTISHEEQGAFNPVDYYHHLMQQKHSLLNRIVAFGTLSRKNLSSSNSNNNDFGAPPPPYASVTKTFEDARASVTSFIGSSLPASVSSSVSTSSSSSSSSSSQSVHFVVLENVIPPHRIPKELYDLKGSTLGRTAKSKGGSDPVSSPDGPPVILKDLDVRRTIRLDGPTRQRLIEVLTSDTQWLARHNVMDYSLLLAVCPISSSSSSSSFQHSNIDPLVASLPPPPPSYFSTTTTSSSSSHCTCCGSNRPSIIPLLAPCPKCLLPVCSYCCNPSKGLSPCHVCYGFVTCPILQQQQQQQPHHSPHASPPTSSESLQSVGSLFRATDGGFLSADGKEIYYVGIIDFLQPFNMRKTLEQKVKTVFLAGGDEMQVSVLEPPKYAHRMVGFLSTLIEEVQTTPSPRFARYNN